MMAVKSNEKLWALTDRGPLQVRADRLASGVLLLWDRFSVSKTIIPEAQEHFLVSSGPRYTPSFGGSG